MPQRYQRSRAKGAHLPPGVVCVGRPSRYGNPFTPDMYWKAGYSGSLEVAIKHCVDAYRCWLENRYHWLHNKNTADMPMLPDLAPLRGRDLACWCPLPEPGQPDICHAAVLLELCNREDGE